MSDEPADEVSRTGLTIGLVIGVPLMIVGIHGLWTHMDATPPSSFLRFFVGGDILNDAVIAPIACLVGFFFVGRLPAVMRAPVRAALFATAIAIAVAWPALRGYGRDRAPDNHTVQPLNYTTAVLTVVGVIWLLAALWLAVDIVRARHDRSRSHPVSE